MKYERLTKRNSEGDATYAKKVKSSYVGAIYEEQREIDKEVLNRLAILEDEIDEGTLVHLPFIQRYDKVYCVLFPDQKYVWEREILNASYDFIDEKLKIEDTQGIISFLGESAFLTKEEAEEKLKSFTEDVNNNI